MNLSPTMRVLLVAKPWAGGLGDYVHRALIDLLGPERVSLIATRPQSMPEKFARARDKKAWNTRLVERIETTAYDAAIFIYPLECFAALTKTQKNITWLVDDLRISPELLRSMGHVFGSDPGYIRAPIDPIPSEKMAGILPFAMLPSIHCPPPNPSSAERARVCFIANRDEKRSTWLAQLLEAGLDCHTYGNYFARDPLFWRYPKNFHRPIAIERMQATYARHDLSLNIHAGVVREGTNMRTFEAAGYGITQLVEYRPGIENLFDPASELPCFRTPEEAIDLARRLLAMPHIAQTMAVAARKRALAEHTYHHRVKTMLARIT